MERRLTSILALDVVGYSRLMGKDEAGTLAALKQHRKDLLDPKVAQYRGRTVKLMGDGALMEFASVVDAVAFAVDVQVAMRARNAAVAADRRIVFRIGINIGDIIVEDGDIFGDGVNVAARLETLAEPGGVCLARNVFNQVKGKLDLDLEHLGERAVKNIAEPVSTYRVVMNDKAERLTTAVQTTKPRRGRQPVLMAATVAALLAVLGLGWWQPWVPRQENAVVESPTASVASPPGIAVLPLDNMGGDPDLEYFSDGMTEDIITELSRIPDIRVVSRNTSFTYKDKPVTARQVGEELSVGYVLEGSVRKQGDRVRITAQLIDAKTDAHVWAEKFDEEGTDIFSLQDRVTQQIAATLTGNEGLIKQAEYRRAWAADAARLDEYDYYLRGHFEYYKFRPEAMMKAREIWQEGLAKYPESGLLRIKIGWTYFQFFRLRWDSTPEKDLERASELALEGLADPRLPPVGQWVGHWLYATVLLFRDRDYDRALEEAAATLELAPHDAETLVFLSQVPTFSGEPDLALEWSERAIDRETKAPLWYYRHLGQAYVAKGDCAQALEAFRRLTWVDLVKNTTAAVCYVELGRLDDARAEIAELLAERPDLTVTNLRGLFPWKDPAVQDRFFAALSQAGLPA